jgi:hypothetical protein
VPHKPVEIRAIQAEQPGSFYGTIPSLLQRILDQPAFGFAYAVVEVHRHSLRRPVSFDHRIRQIFRQD